MPADDAMAFAMKEVLAALTAAGNFDQAATDDDGSGFFPGDLCDDGNP